ncbi:ubiquitin-like protein Pup [Leekyejoonella antrihumi]|uniref:Prokaryotic ubiquitin-like protein Pup n=1 Tax=Leekyejoonella antrihumi TaxID=1660198 RepID=A0A563E4S5_9MICO|nr:ubiquitin-like protein Pup [Leekyejoonella antrihumi]TWP36874.1 ubiquitin-like protein Pup [Leekyejoonella antrihumi]
MATQEHKSPQRRDDDVADDAPEPVAPSGGAAQVQDADTDDVLDEIDGVLESNAEEFVRGFVQKGGQ